PPPTSTLFPYTTLFRSVQHWDLATGKARATFWTPVSPGGNHPEAGHVVGFFFAALSADGKTVAWGGAEGDGKITGTAHVWEVQSDRKSTRLNSSHLVIS